VAASGRMTVRKMRRDRPSTWGAPDTRRSVVGEIRRGVDQVRAAASRAGRDISVWYHASMALNIKDPETERLAAEVAALTGTTKTGAVRYALRQVLQAQSHLSVQQREERLTRFLEEEIWPLVPPDQLGKPVSKAEREEILGFGEDGA
jgi:antitoxin VapB